MIKANELRVGNIVNDLFDKKSFPLSANIIKAKDILEINTDSKRESWYEGVSLTPEILVRCGFEKKGDHHWGIPKIYNFELSFHRSNLWNYYRLVTVRFKGSQNSRYAFPHCIKYLHQLQNLFFALTGEELKVNL